jgi:hypothetical protein
LPCAFMGLQFRTRQGMNQSKVTSMFIYRENNNQQ